MLLKFMITNEQANVAEISLQGAYQKNAKLMKDLRQKEHQVRIVCL